MYGRPHEVNFFSIYMRIYYMDLHIWGINRTYYMQLYTEIIILYIYKYNLLGTNIMLMYN